MSTLLRSMLVLFALSGAVQPALAYPDHTIYVDMTHVGTIDSGPYSGSYGDDANLVAR
jgi:hypothetical protein